MAKLTLAEGSFSTMREGKQAVVILSAEAKPASNPQKLYIKVANAFNETVENSYTLNPKEEKAFKVTSIFLKACLGSVSEFDTDDVQSLVGKFIEVEITHTEKDSTKHEGKKVTFANITKTFGGAEPFGEAQAPKRTL